MRKLYINNALISIKEYFIANTAKFVLAILSLILGIVFGARSAVNVSDYADYVDTNFSLWFTLLLERRAIAFFFLNIFISALILTAFILCSNLLILSVLSIAILFLYSYSFVFSLFVYISLYKLAVIPYVVLCLIPCFTIIFTVFAFGFVMALTRAKEIKQFGIPCGSFKCFARSYVIPAILLGAVTFILTLIGSILTIVVVS